MEDSSLPVVPAPIPAPGPAPSATESQLLDSRAWVHSPGHLLLGPARQPFLCSCSQVVHTGEKPYCCLVCELRFSSRSSLGRHLKRQHRGTLPSPLQPSPGLPPLSSPCSVCCNVGPCSVCGGGGSSGGAGLEGAGATSWGLAEAAAAAAASLPPFACGACAF
ncbi:flt3-interacting zinc finger protein 1 [Mus pahari]|uniref:flt3-interacting zinc finger protein 1 n=1 Tax=Mus pahari TaxID=10093 RepID=UPI001114A8EF|nr:flt3-interacting zinc finger protein 1 [Mus pahari]